jgi:hypothetical protein
MQLLSGPRPGRIIMAADFLFHKKQLHEQVLHGGSTSTYVG